MQEKTERKSVFTMTAKTAAALVVAGTLMLSGSAAFAQEETSTDDNWQEYQCSPGILGTGIACNSAPAPGPAPEDDAFQGGPLGSDSDLANGLRYVLGGGIFN